MTNDLNDQVPAPEKLEWVTPKISLMEAGAAGGKQFHFRSETAELPSYAPS
jgi:hypothetical protein